MSDNRINRRTAVSFAVAAALAGSYSTAVAQDDTGVEEITVTAAKREQSIQDISIAVTALGEEDLWYSGCRFPGSQKLSGSAVSHQ